MGRLATNWCRFLLRALRNGHRLTDGLLLGLFGLVAFLLVCNELYEADIWWHLRSGAWILENGRPPDGDPFTFGAQGRPWIDLHWGYQLLLGLVFRSGGIPALIVFGAAIVAVALIIAVAARPAGVSLSLALACWVPALVLTSVRNQPRPEVFTLLFLAVYLAVVVRLEQRPRLVWLLPGVQFLWVNMHGLFILGPIVLGMWLFAQVNSWVWQRLHGQAPAKGPLGQGRWHLLGANLAVWGACLLNPYGLSGVLFPLHLYPKVTAEGNLHRENIGEFFSPRKVAAMIGPEQVGNNWYFCAFYLLLVLVPLSFLLPALWQASRPASTEGNRQGLPVHSDVRSSRIWSAVLAIAVALVVLRSLTLSPRGRPASLLALGEAVPLLFAAAGVMECLVLGRRSFTAAGLALGGGCGLAAWMGWLADYLQCNQATADATAASPSVALLLVAVLSAALAGALVLRCVGSLFGLLLVGAFGYLALSAMYNWSRLGLVAGVLIALNLGAWVGRLRPAPPGGSLLSWAGRLGMAGLFLAWLVAILTGVYPQWVQSDFGFGEKPLTFAHDAARFAGQSAMPRRAVVFPMQTAALYIYHHAPGHLTFMDCRLELFSMETFQTHLSVLKQLNKGHPRAIADLDALEAPVVMMGHAANTRAEATLLLHPNWRLVYFDALASVFLARTDSPLDERFPSLDLGARHFAQAHAHSLPDTAGAAREEARALFDLGHALGKDPGTLWRWRIPILLAALDRVEVALAEEPTQATLWRLLSSGHASLLGEMHRPPSTVFQGWDAETGLAWAQATYALRRGLECDPDDSALRQTLFRSFTARDMLDAQLSKRPGDRAGSVPRPAPTELPGLLTRALDSHQAGTAARWAAEALANGQADWDWQLADRLAGVCLHLGQPALARQVWQGAKGPPDEAVRQTRLADASWVERNYAVAIHHYREARRLDPRLQEPCWALAWLYAQRGEAGPALAACREALALSLAPNLRDEMHALEELLVRSAR
jgi:tetratricopeptide (TPR) repeat protein